MSTEQATVWCEFHWNSLVREKFEKGEVIAMAITTELIRIACGTKEFQEFAEPFPDKGDAIPEFIRNTGPLCCAVREDVIRGLAQECSREKLALTPIGRRIIAAETAAKRMAKAWLN